MRPDVVTFWYGPLDAVRRLCLKSQVAAGHRVTVYSFEPLAGLPDGVDNAEAEAILPYAFSERLRPAKRDGTWIDWTMLQFSDFFRMRLLARNAGLWLDADVLLLKPVEIDPAKPYFAWERPSQLGNSVLYLPPGDPIVAAFTALIQQDALTPDWMAGRHRARFALRRLFGAKRPSDVRLAIYGPPALTALAERTNETHYALPKKSFYAVHAEPRLFFEPQDISELINDPDVIGCHISPKKRVNEIPVPGSLYAWAAERFGT
jgi:hypothetical protein